MFDQATLEAIVQRPESAEALFKPVQRRVIEKLATGVGLDENEKRYLRGNLGKKLAALETLIGKSDNRKASPFPFLLTLDNYYISGFEALRHNGFGWFYETKVVMVINTRLKGSVLHDGKTIRFVRVRTMWNRKWEQDEATGLRYATNSQITHDAKELKDSGLERTCHSMRERYGNLFISGE